MTKKTLETRLLGYFNSQSNPRQSATTWSLANALYDNCMQKSQAGNGIKVANIRKVAEKSDKLDYFIDGNGSACVALKNPPNPKST